MSDIKKAIQNKERVLVATNMKTRLILLAASTLSAAAITASASSTAAVGGAANRAVKAAGLALSPGHKWTIIIITGLALLIPTLRGDHVRIFVEHDTTRFGVEYGGRDKR